MGAPQPASQLRRRPRQARARLTVDRILDAAAALLDSGGLEAVNTNAIAARAGVNVATLYAYFNDKYEVLRALGERFDAKRSALIGEALADEPAWADALEAGLVGFVSLLVSEPGAGALLDVARTCPELRDVDAGVHEKIAKALAGFLQSRNGSLGRARARSMAAMLVEASSGVVGLARQATPRERKRILAEYQTMLRAYFESSGL